MRWKNEKAINKYCIGITLKNFSEGWVCLKSTI
jgi:hypothetical protein